MIITLPHESKTFEAHGRKLTVVRHHTGAGYHAYFVLGGQTRFGDKEQITADIEHFLLNGTLPQCKVNLSA